MGWPNGPMARRRAGVFVRDCILRYESRYQELPQFPARVSSKGTWCSRGRLVSGAASAVYVVVLVFLGIAVARTAHGKKIEDTTPVVSRTLTAAVVLAAVFFGSFYLLGFVELISGRPVVYSVGASLIGIPIAVILGVLTLKARFECASVTYVRVHDSMAGRLCFLYIALFAVIGVALLPAFPIGYEGLAKHLSIGRHFMQANTLLPWDMNASHTHAAGVSLYFGFLMGFLPERLLTLANVPFTVLLCVATFGLGHRLSGDNQAALWSVVGMLTIPLVSFNVFETEADLAGIAFLATATYFVIAQPDTRIPWPVLAGLAAGIAFGCKPVHLIGAGYLFLVVAMTSILNESRSGSTGAYRRLFPVAMFAVAGLAMAGYWLVRDYVLFGNPLYPAHLPFFDLLGWPAGSDLWVESSVNHETEWVRRSSEWLLYPWLEWHELDQNFKATSGLGAFFAASIPVALLTSGLGVLGLGRACRSTRRNLFVLIAGSIVVLLAWWSLGRQPRYAMGVLVFLLPLVSWMVAQLRDRARRSLDVVFALSALAMLFVVTSAYLIEVGDRLLHSRQFTRAAFYGYPDGLDRLPPGATVLNLAERLWNYRLHGEGLRNRVISSRETVRLLAIMDDTSVTGGGRRFYLCTRRSPESEKNCRYRLDTGILRGVNATHLFMVGTLEIESDGCTTLYEIDRLDRNPVNNVLLREPRVLYEVRYCTQVVTP